MNLIITKNEELEDIVQASVERSLEKFFKEKTEKEAEQKTFSVKETANFLNVSELTVRNYIKRGFIEAEQIGHRIFINREKLMTALKEVKSFKYKR